MDAGPREPRPWLHLCGAVEEKRPGRAGRSTISNTPSRSRAIPISSKSACRPGRTASWRRGRNFIREKYNLPTRQETRGDIPTWERIHHEWRDGDTANICIGQGEVAVTPLQMAVAYAAIANGGTVFWPRLVSRIEPQDPSVPEPATNFPSARVRDHLGVSAAQPENVARRDAGRNRGGHRQGGAGAGPEDLRQDGHGASAGQRQPPTGYNYWFASFAPYENPRYAVVVMAQVPGPWWASAARICAPDRA